METNSSIHWRLGQLDRDVSKLDEEKADRRDVERLERQMGRMTAAFYTLAVGIVLASVTFAFTVAQLH